MGRVFLDGFFVLKLLAESCTASGMYSEQPLPSGLICDEIPFETNEGND